MRDVAITAVILGTIPFILRAPWLGVLAFVGISLFNPHRYAWGFAYDFPFVEIIAITTMASMLFHLKEVRFPVAPVTVLLIVLPLWMTVTLIFAFEPVPAYERWQEVMKAFLFILISASLVHTRKHIDALIWILVLSVGYYGVKGGIYTIVTGGGGRVWGPPGKTYITDNNAIGVALIMVIPLMNYLRTAATARWVRQGLAGAMLLSALAVLGTHSRGAFLAVLATCYFLWLKNRRKLASGIAIVALVAAGIAFMPSDWMGRMETIETYQQDDSAMIRINVWHMAFNLANDRPLIGGGFEPYSAATFARYAPDPQLIYSAHSIYFQVLGEHGYVGLGLFLALGLAGWRTARKVIEASRARPELAWCADLARAIQTSLVGFAVGGAFVNIAYWELQYYELVALVAAFRLACAAPAAERAATLWQRATARAALKSSYEP